MEACEVRDRAAGVEDFLPAASIRPCFLAIGADGVIGRNFAVAANPRHHPPLPLPTPVDGPCMVKYNSNVD